MEIEDTTTESTPRQSHVWFQNKELVRKTMRDYLAAHGHARIQWATLLAGNPQLKEQLGITDENLHLFRGWIYRTLPGEAPTRPATRGPNAGKLPKAKKAKRAYTKRSRIAEHVENDLAGLTPEPQYASREAITTAPYTEAPVSFCPVCGSDLRECKAKARLS